MLSYRLTPGAARVLAQAPGLLAGAGPRTPVPRGQQLLGPWRRWDPTARYLGTGACPAAFLPGRMAAFGQQLPVCGPSPEDLCAHSSQASSWKGKEGCIIRGKAYRLYLPRLPHFPCLPPPAPPLPSSFTLSGGFSIACASFFFFFPLSFWARQGCLSGWKKAVCSWSAAAFQRYFVGQL